LKADSILFPILIHINVHTLTHLHAHDGYIMTSGIQLQTLRFLRIPWLSPLKTVGKTCGFTWNCFYVLQS